MGFCCEDALPHIKCSQEQPEIKSSIMNDNQRSLNSFCLAELVVIMQQTKTHALVNVVYIFC